ncbi:MAG: hypothetical protein APR63_01470 [Desulfuromonas sp. SDB]|nr:MAG: hypothetical protein APR63_01470 [Desulfuromonas sp. SDB]
MQNIHLNTNRIFRSIFVFIKFKDLTDTAVINFQSGYLSNFSTYLKFFYIAVLIVLPCTIVASSPLPPREVIARDFPDDRGGKILITWERSITDSVISENNVWGYKVYRFNVESGDTLFLGFVDRWQELTFVDNSAADGTIYQYLVQTKSSAGSSSLYPSNLISSKAGWFYWGRIQVLIFLILVSAVFWWFRKESGDNKYKHYYRRIDWSVEKGKSVMVILNFHDFIKKNDLSRTIEDLSEIAERVIRADGNIKVLTSGEMMNPVSEAVRKAFMKMGKLDLFRPFALRRVWSWGPAFSEEACRLVHRWKPGVIVVMGDPGRWVFPAVNAGIDENAEIIGWNLNRELLSAGMINDLNEVEIEGFFSKILNPSPKLKFMIYIILTLTMISMLYVSLYWLLQGNQAIMLIEQFREILTGLLVGR